MKVFKYFRFLSGALFLLTASSVHAEWFKPVDAEAYLRAYDNNSPAVEYSAPKRVKLLDDTPIPPPDYGEAVKVTPGNAARVKVLNRVTGRVKEVSVAQGDPIVVEGFKIALSDCRVKSFPDNARFTSADLYISDTLPKTAEEIIENAEQAAKPLFEGSMYVETPGVSAFEHPVYDIWLTDCTVEAKKNSEPAA